MTIQGTVTHILPVQSGKGKNGTWYKYGFVLSTGGQYPKSVAIEVWKDDPLVFIGQPMTAHIDIESREHNGRWFTAVKAYKIEGDARPASGNSARPAKPQRPIVDDSEEDDLPF